MKQYLEFNELETERKTKVFEIRNKETQDYLGDIAWDTGWRQYVFIQRIDEQIKMSRGCLIQLGEFLNELMEESK